jgi:hypothetical protein
VRKTEGKNNGIMDGRHENPGYLTLHWSGQCCGSNRYPSLSKLSTRSSHQLQFSQPSCVNQRYRASRENPSHPPQVSCYHPFGQDIYHIFSRTRYSPITHEQYCFTCLLVKCESRHSGICNPSSSSPRLDSIDLGLDLPSLFFFCWLICSNNP